MTSNEVRRCRQCGTVKPMEQYRPYYEGKSGYYRTCRSCEKINSRAKYLERKTRSVPEDEELNKIYRLYSAQEACGLRPPRSTSGKQPNVTEDLDKQIAAYAAQASVLEDLPAHLDPASLPPEIRKWLSTTLTREPDYYLDEVYEDLRSKYRPMLRVDEDTLLPVYDETYRAALNALLDKFNRYEDSYYES